jgi:hypothetical protein
MRYQIQKGNAHLGSKSASRGKRIPLNSLEGFLRFDRMSPEGKSVHCAKPNFLGKLTKSQYN